MAGGAIVRCGVVVGAATAGILPAFPPVRLSAQSAIHAEIGRLFEADGWTTYRLGMERRIAGPVGVAFYGTHLRDQSAVGRRHWGAGADLVVLRGHRAGPYLIGGLAGGFSSDSADDWWRSWSAGGGFQLVLTGAIAMAGEARWRNVAPGRRDGVELTVRLGALFGGPGRSSGREPASRPAAGLPPAPADAPAVAAPNAAPAGLADSVVATALETLGTGYRLGGTTSDGFDCSGLIQHAYGRHGIKLPRVSRDQAREGEAVNRDLDALRPGDILTFSERGDRVTHVGLYLGDGRFVHSARRGVQVSALSDSDPYGRWWWRRWVGARRIVSSIE